MTEERRLIRPRRPGDEPVAPIVLDTLQHQTGLTKREHFAALILAGLHANSKTLSYVNCDELIEVAVRQADALVTALEKGDREVV